jgi:hypothetical protein
MGFNPPLISCDPPFIGHLCLTLHFYRSSVLDAVGTGQPDGVQPVPDHMLPSLLQVLCARRSGQPDGVQPAPDLMRSSLYRSSVLDAVGSQMGFNPPLIGTLRDSQKGEEGGPLSWSKAASVYPYTALGIKALERYVDCRFNELHLNTVNEIPVKLENLSEQYR